MDILKKELVDTVRFLYSKGWSPGTGGNFSVVSAKDFSLLMTPSSIDKGSVTEEQLIEVGRNGEKISGRSDLTPSAETLIHIAVIEETGAQSVLHTHSVPNTVLSLQEDVVEISGLEMLKGLSGVRTHEHSERIPVLPNSQDMKSFSSDVRALLREEPKIHGFLMRGHGLYTWGSSLFEARRHVEVLEFLFEVTLSCRESKHKVKL